MASCAHQRLQVILAGHNGDVEALKGGAGVFSPETLSAAYARISRSPEPAPVLRRRARAEVERARRSNQTIVFGLGHHSVAEHAVLNFDVLGCSRLAIEALEWHRLCSFTEKSQRYITLDGDHVTPAELDRSEADDLEQLVAEQNDLYRRLLPMLEARLLERHPEMSGERAQRTVLEGWAKEDARYVVSLATSGQLGLTCNARNLELMIRRMRAAELAEVRQLGGLLFTEAQKIVPSLVVLADQESFRKAYGVTLRDRYFEHGQREAQDAAAAVAVKPSAGSGSRRRGDVTLVAHSPDPDAAVIAHQLFAAGRGPLELCQQAAAGLPAEQRRGFFRTALASLSEFDSPPRAFEAASFAFEVLVDASAMAQLKRHRMTTQIWGVYDPSLGCTVPPAIEEIDERDSFTDLVDRTSERHAALSDRLLQRGVSPRAADYLLTNAHRRRVAMRANLRELYHFSRLREDRHAQWAIRRLAADISALVREVAPAASMLLGGKDRYAEIYRRAMGREYEP